MKNPNIITILCDQLRYDVFSHRGNKHIHTPHIDRLAQNGACFNQATCSFPVCGPARAALLTGNYSYDAHYSCLNREPEQNSIFKENTQTIDQALHDAGYHVEYHGKWHNGNSHRDCYQGDNKVWGHQMNEWHDYIAQRYERPSGDNYAVDSYSNWPYRKVALDDITNGDAAKDWAVYNNNSYGIFEIENEDTMTAYTMKKTLRFLDSRPENKPFAVTCSILHPHLPFTPNEYYASLFNPEDMPIPDNIDAYYKPEFNLFHGKADKKKAIPDLIRADGSDVGLGQFLALYYALVKEIDDQIGLLLASLEEKGLLENTLIILTSDHGDMGGSHNCFAKFNFFEESLRVPLIMHWPAQIPAGLSLDTPASGVDIAPSIFEAATGQAFPCHGRSLISDIRSESSPIDWAYAEMISKDNEAFHCMRNKDWKIIFDETKTPIIAFDLTNDPGEFHDVLEGSSEIATSAQDKLLSLFD